jgi:alpha-1,6-mannosyltransferase
VDVAPPDRQSIQQWSLISRSLSVSPVASVLIDSFFWRRPVWPEWEVLYFNTLKKDAEGRMFTGANAWGTEPFWWYIAIAVPKSLMATLLLLPLALLRRIPSTFKDLRVNPRSYLLPDLAVLQLFLPLCLFLLLYSFLAHKELRFIYPILPALTCVAAVGWRKMARAREGKEKEEDDATTRSQPGSSAFSIINLVYRGVQLALLLSTFVSLAALHSSSWNYPGGSALAMMRPMLFQNGVCRSTTKPLIHISNLAATTGASRFGQLEECARYSKQEGIAVDQYHLHPFDYLISETPTVPGFTPVPSMDPVRGFTKLARNFRQFPPVEVGVEPMLWVMERKEAWREHQEGEMANAQEARDTAK